MCKTKRRNDIWRACGNKKEAKSIISGLRKFLRHLVFVWFFLFNENNKTPQNLILI